MREMGCRLGAIARERETGGDRAQKKKDESKKLKCPVKHMDNGTNSGKALPEPPPPPPTDPRLPLTARQKFSILKSWKGISRAMEPTGVYMFIK